MREHESYLSKPADDDGHDHVDAAPPQPPPPPPPSPEYPPPGQQMLVVPRWYEEQRRWATFAAAVALGLGTPRTLLGE